jgi:hypothetical protein
MSSILPILILALVLVFLIIRRAPKEENTSVVRPDFKVQESGSRFVTRDPAAISLARSKGSDFNYEVVGESFRRDNLMKLIRSHNAVSIGKILTTATLEPEPTNPFDSTAVKVLIEGLHVGYIAKIDSSIVTEMIKKSKKKSYEVPARIGWDKKSLSPLIGVKLTLKVE